MMILLPIVIDMLATNLYLITSSNLVKERFDGWNAGEFDLTYTMRSVGEYMREQKDRKELLLYNYGIKGLATTQLILAKRI